MNAGPRGNSQRRPGLLLTLFSSALPLLLIVSCTTKKVSPPAAPLTGPALIQRGKAVYMGNCISCHNADPTKPGAIGPDVAGSSLELIEGRVLSLKYPTGYKPKRGTALMAPLPFLKNEISALHAYLNSPSASGNP